MIKEGVKMLKRKETEIYKHIVNDLNDQARYSFGKIIHALEKERKWNDTAQNWKESIKLDLDNHENLMRNKHKLNRIFMAEWYVSHQLSL